MESFFELYFIDYDYNIDNNYVIIDSNELQYMYNNINANFLFLLFSISFVSSCLCLIKNPQNVKKNYFIVPSYDKHDIET